MQKRRDDILDTAERLFNEHGYNAVSLRDIADVLQISKGNLTYHFQKKEDLIEACVVRNHENYKKPAVPQTLEELNAFFAMLIRGKEARPYYFQNYIQLAQVCPRVYDIQRSVVEDFADVIVCAMQKLTQDGVLREDCVDEYAGIAQCILSVITYGVAPSGDQTADAQLSCIQSVLQPCLTEQGRAAYNGSAGI